MVRCQRLHQVGSTEVSLGLVLFIASEPEGIVVIKLHVVCSRKGLVFQSWKNGMQIKQSNHYIIQIPSSRS